MDSVVIVLLVLLGVIILTKGKPLWSFVKQLWDSLPPSGFSGKGESWMLGDYFFFSLWTLVGCYIIWWVFLS